MPNPSLLPSNVVCTRSGAPLLCCQALALLQRRLYVTLTAFRPQQAAPPHPIVRMLHTPHAPHQHNTHHLAPSEQSPPGRVRSPPARPYTATPWAALRSSGGRRGAGRRNHDLTPTPPAVGNPIHGLCCQTCLLYPHQQQNRPYQDQRSCHGPPASSRTRCTACLRCNSNTAIYATICTHHHKLRRALR